MANLTITAHYSRRIIKTGVILLIGFFVVKGSLRVASLVWKNLNPPKSPGPNVAFGKLPSIVFPVNQNLPDLTYKLETIEGTLPTVKDIEKVYFVPNDANSFLTTEEAINKAKAIGFTNQPKERPDISPFTYEWQLNETIPSSLIMETVSKKFTFKYDYEKDQSLLNITSLITTDQALQIVKDFLRKSGSLPADINSGPVNYIYYHYQPPILNEVSSLSETDFIKVNLLRSNLNDLQVLPVNPYDANIAVMVSKSEAKKVIYAKYAYFRLDLEVWGTYPLKSTTQAWDELKNNQGFVANLGDNTNGEVTIRKVYLAYFDPDNHQNYLQPIFVFEGDRKFFAYVPAVTKEWIEKAQH